MSQFGAKITKDWEPRYAQSPHWKNGKFHNLEATAMDMRLVDIPGLLYKQFTAKNRRPDQPIPLQAFDREAFLAPASHAKFIWYGHSALLMRMQNKTLLIDPMLGPDAAPVGPIRIKRFSPGSLEIIDQLPEIDLVLMSHDHYDHLDLASIARLKGKVKQYYVAMGVERHLISWGIAPEQINSFDWWQQESLNDIAISFTPSRHFSGRGLRDRFKSLWGGWVFHTNQERIYFSGDGGYGSHFQEVGKRLGPFNIGFMECGQYNERWHLIHMFPEEAVTAARDAGVQKAVPVHWGGFSLALHPWNEPVDRFVAAATKNDLPIVLPAPGELFTAGDEKTTAWWKKYL